jgi:glucose-6-phosphate 1-dehydrogenase
MKRAFRKWGCLFGIGIAVLGFTAFCFFRREYTWVMAGLFVGLFLTSASWKKIRLHLKAEKAIKEGKEEILIHYRDRNLKESQLSVIPAGADTFYFYGLLPEENDIKTFRWQGIRKAFKNGKELTRANLLESL